MFFVRVFQSFRKKIPLRCSSALKCCWINNCNRSCTMPENLNRISTFTLPPIPTDLSAVSMEHSVRRKAKLSWLMRIPHNRCNEQIDYIFEARAHVGYSFSKHKLGQWFAINTENIHLESMHSHNSKCVLNKQKKTHTCECIVKFILCTVVAFFSRTQSRISCLVTLQIGRFYEFRVLALNGNGTRGCSESTLFQLNESKCLFFFKPINFQNKLLNEWFFLQSQSIYRHLLI